MPNESPLQEGGKTCIGRVGAPPQKEATSTKFYFWTPENQLVEKTQIITCESAIAGENYTFYGIVNEVYRQSRKRSMGAEIDEIDEKSALEIGLIKNGVNTIAGPGVIDLDYLLGTNGGHMNVNGSAGRGTKSSFLLHVNWLLLHKARSDAKKRPFARDRWLIAPIILNVKGHDSSTLIAGAVDSIQRLTSETGKPWAFKIRDHSSR